MNGWKQTIVVIMTMLSAGVSSMFWLENRFDQIERRQAIDLIEMEATRKRITEYGFSLRQAQRFVDDLRREADHPVPPIRHWQEVTE